MLHVDPRCIHEIEVAREVQQRLFPQELPPVRTLDYGGLCLQARGVGGDYYDFLDLGGGRIALVMADVSGKGIAAALLMANLQASLRSQCALAVNDLPRLLSSVNRLFYESTPANRYATLFFAVYVSDTRTLSYVNCGHNRPALLRRAGDVQWLDPTASVLGLFEEWQCTSREVQLQSGDTLVICTDGVTEAFSATPAEYGETRLLEAARCRPDLSASALIAEIVRDVQSFAMPDDMDDLTLVVARCVS
jgi:serine phosphatase RsbU (regulator of sigma subunit)